MINLPFSTVKCFSSFIMSIFSRFFLDRGRFWICPQIFLIFDPILHRIMTSTIATENMTLEVGEHRGANFQNLIAVVVHHSRDIGKEHKIRQRKSQRVYICFIRGDWYSCLVNFVLLLDGKVLRVTNVSYRNCDGRTIS